MSDKMIGWFAKRHKESILKMLREHTQLALAVANEFVKIVKGVTEGKLGEVDKRHRIIAMTEKKADVLRRRNIGELTRSELSLKDREDLMRLASSVDWVANSIYESSRILMVLLPMIKKIFNLCEPLKKISVDLAELLQKSTGYLVDSVEKLIEREVETSLNLADKIECIEEEIDDLHEEARKQMLKFDSSETSMSIVIFSQFFDAMETTADNCEHVCDQIRAIAVGITRPR